jgi:hypothetical protein
MYKLRRNKFYHIVRQGRSVASPIMISFSTEDDVPSTGVWGKGSTEDGKPSTGVWGKGSTEDGKPSTGFLLVTEDVGPSTGLFLWKPLLKARASSGVDCCRCLFVREVVTVRDLHVYSSFRLSRCFSLLLWSLPDS